MSENKELVTTQAQPPAEIWDSIPVQVCQRALQVRDAVQDYVKSNLSKAPYMEKLPGTDRPFFKQEGGEALLLGFQLKTKTTILDQVEDYDHGFFKYQVEVEIQTAAGQPIGRAVGMCHSKERSHGYVWKGAKAIQNDPRLKGLDLTKLPSRSGQYGTSYQIPNPDIADKAHTIFVMAEKRAMMRGLARTFSLHEHWHVDDPDQYPDKEPEKDKTPPKKTTSKSTADKSSPEQVKAIVNKLRDACSVLELTEGEYSDAVMEMFKAADVVGMDDPTIDGKALNTMTKWIMHELPKYAKEIKSQ